MCIIIVFLQSLRQNMAVHLDQYRVYHAQLQAESFDEIRQLMTKLNLSFDYLLERQSRERVQETRSNALERLQDALEQRIELLDDHRDRHAGVGIEEQATYNTSILTVFGDTVTEIDRSGAGARLTSGYNTGSTALERLQDALEQRIEFLDDRRDRHAVQNDVKIERLEDQATQNTSLLTMIDKRITDMEVKGGIGLTSGYNIGSTAFGHSEVPITLNYQGFGDANVPPQRVEALHTRVVELEQSVDRALSSCLDQELRIQLLERATYNGVLLWKIDEFDRRRREAVDGVTLSLYSTPFYTSRHGYKMCARVYLNGDGMGKGSHLSFFFVIMRGPFDASFQWPFKQKVTLSLINQNGKKHISDSFRPDPHSSSFQKPGRREMNIASGCPMFIRIDHLLNGGFVKDDAIYVRVVVETMDLPKIIP